MQQTNHRLNLILSPQVRNGLPLSVRMGKMKASLLENAVTTKGVTSLLPADPLLTITTTSVTFRYPFIACLVV